MTTMMTEDEAEQKWCPFTFCVADANRVDGGPWHCCTSKCMAWTVDERTTTEGRLKGSDQPWEIWAWNPREHTHDPRQARVLAEYEFRDADKRGYCAAMNRR